MFYYVRKVSIYTHVHQVWSLNSRWHFTTHGIRPWISRRFFLGVSIIFEFHSSNFRGVYPPGKNKPQLLVVFFPGPEGWLFPGAFSFGHTVGGNGIDAERSGKFDSYDNHYHRNWKNPCTSQILQSYRMWGSAFGAPVKGGWFIPILTRCDWMSKVLDYTDKIHVPDIVTYIDPLNIN